MRTIWISTMVTATLLLWGCGSKENQEAGVPEQAPASAETPGAVMSGIAGVHWTLPPRWVPQGERPMRIATYTIPAAEGDTEAGECAVFYFGHDQGGDVRMNIDRWIGQFENPHDTKESTSEVGDIKVTLVTTTGTYLSPGGPAMQSQGSKENFKLNGAIVEAPGGLVFFKVVGPARTLDAAAAEFTGMIGSLKK